MNGLICEAKPQICLLQLVKDMKLLIYRVINEIYLSGLNQNINDVVAHLPRVPSKFTSYMGSAEINN